MTTSIRSVARKTTAYVGSAVLLAVLIIVASSLYMGLPTLTSTSGGSQGSTSIAGPQSLLVVQLTDPPQVPLGTRSLNLTYSSISLAVGEPSGNGKVNPTDVKVNPTGGSATLNLLKLQNVSQTIASANLPNGSVIYSVTFTVSSISLNVNGTVSPVTLATGGNTLLVVISQPSTLQGENVALLQLNPIIVGTPTGYQLIPSAVGVIKHSQGQGEEQVGSRHQMSNEDNGDLHSAKGNLTANLVTLSVSGNTTTATVQVVNAGGAAVTISAIGLHGNFTTTASQCSTTTTTHTSTHQGESDHHMCELPEHMNEVVFVPVVSTTTSTTTSSTVTSTSCSSGQMSLVNGDGEGDKGFVLQAGQCVNFTFAGKITFGQSGNVLLPSTLKGQAYDVHVIGSEGANIQLTCILPLGPSSCKAQSQDLGMMMPFG